MPASSPQKITTFAALLRERELDIIDIEIMSYLKENPASTAVELREKMEISKSSMSRHILFLTGSNTTKGSLKTGTDGKRLNTPKEMAFVSMQRNDKNKQRPYLSLTNRGSNVITDFCNIIEDK